MTQTYSNKFREQARKWVPTGVPAALVAREPDVNGKRQIIRPVVKQRRFSATWFPAFIRK